MNIYKYIKLALGHKIPAPIKLMGLACMMFTGRRFVGIFLDPAMACNIRCKMCYFSQENRKACKQPNISEATIDNLQKALFHRALKLQIGCGAEPTLYPHLLDLVQRGHESGIPYISLTTNGQLIATGRVNLMQLVEAGLNEITISMHGTSAATYEELMTGAKFERLQQLLCILHDVKGRFPEFQIRANFTVNSLNVDDLADGKFWDVWTAADVFPDVVQLRPVQNIGESIWQDFDLTPLRKKYTETIGAVIAQCGKRGILCLAPSIDDLNHVTDDVSSVPSLIEKATYCYVSSDSFSPGDFDLEKDTCESYHKRLHTVRRLFLSAIFPGYNKRNKHTKEKTKALNYHVS
jgi:wyosine [tRNA(Phe)-imidazoG37] synthetase (radical SAM superfamily)